MAESLPLAGLKVLQNSGSLMFMLRVKPCQCQITTGKIQEKKLLRAQQYKKCVSAQTCHEKWQLCCRTIQHHVRIEPMSPVNLRQALTTQPLVLINCLEKTEYDSSYYLNCFTLLFWVQNCQSQIAQVEYQG